MNKYKIIRLAAWIVFVIAFCCWGYTKLLYLDAEVSYKDLEKKVVSVVEEPVSGTQSGDSQTPTDPFLSIDTESLLDINHDYIGWLSACGDKISYPMVKGRTNDEYLHLTFFREKNFVGSIFADHRCGSDLNDFQTVIYGHSMKDWTMFRAVVQYTDKAYAQQYPYFYIYKENERRKYEIFSVYDISSTQLVTALGDPTQEEKEAFIKAVSDNALYDMGIAPTADDRIVSLITCDVRDDSKRVVVNALLTEVTEIPEKGDDKQ